MKIVNIVLTKKLHEWLRKRSYESKKSMSEIVRDAISAYINIGSKKKS